MITRSLVRLATVKKDARCRHGPCHLDTKNEPLNLKQELTLLPAFHRDAHLDVHTRTFIQQEARKNDKSCRYKNQDVNSCLHQSTLF